ncbi:MAG: hypothetical protein SPL30_02135 [Succinivibrio sp.]|nr:hypothetical protein [Succinivibrio sp.]
MVISKDDYDSLAETVYLLSHDKQIAEDVKEALDPDNDRFIDEQDIQWR